MRGSASPYLLKFIGSFRLTRERNRKFKEFSDHILPTGYGPIIHLNIPFYTRAEGCVSMDAACDAKQIHEETIASGHVQSLIRIYAMKRRAST